MAESNGTAFDALKAYRGGLQQGNTQPANDNYYHPYHPVYPSPCPGCGRCPVCGHGGHYFEPYKITYCTAQSNS